jgi:uncharacterized protein YpuA (DUF1002 family)
MNKGYSKYIIIGGLMIIAAVVVGLFAMHKNAATVFAPSKPVATAEQPVVTSGNSSDSQLDSDLNSVSTNLNSLNTENTQVDSGINQKAVDPTQ